MRNIRIAVLDSGISGSYARKNGVNIICRKHFFYDYSKDIIMENEDTEDLNGHGTMCVSTMLNAFKNIDFIIIKMLNISGVTNEAVLLKALEYVNNPEMFK